MKKSFFAKLGHFFLVSALLFNTFGVAFVHADNGKLNFVSGTNPTEGGSWAALASLSNTSQQNLTCTVSVSGAATLGVDYALTTDGGTTVVTLGNTFTVVIPKQTSSVISIASAGEYNDVAVEGNESIVFTIPAGQCAGESGSSLGLPISYTGTIFDNDVDPATYAPTFSNTTSAVYEGSATGAKVTKLINSSNTDLVYTIKFTSSATLGQDFGLFVINDQNSSTEITDSDSFTVSIAKNSSSTFSVYTNGSYDNTSFDNVAKQTIWTVTNVNDGNANYDLSSNNIQFTLDIRDDENNVNFLYVETSVDEGTALNDSTATFTGGYKLAYSNGTDNDVSLTFELSGTASASTDYTIRTDELSSNSTWIIPKNSTKSFPVNTLNVNGSKTLILTITQVDILDDSHNVKNSNIIPILPGSQKHTLNIVDIGDSINHAPTTTDTTLGTQNIDLYVTATATINSTTVASLFTDVDEGDTLTYSITNNTNPAVVTTTFVNGDLILTGLIVGTSNVEITATDPHGASVARTFDVVVNDSTPTDENNAPTITEAIIETQNLDLYATSTAVVSSTTIESLFTDADEDTLTYSITGNTNPAVVTTTFENGNLVLTGLTVGTSTIEITATDSHGASVARTFAVVVSDSTPTDENNPPTITEATLGTQSIDLHITAIDTIVSTTIESLFTDADEDTLTYSITGNTNPAVVTTTFENGDLVLTGLVVGVSTIELTATDSHGATAFRTFDVVVTDSTPSDGGGSNSGNGSSGGGGLLPNTAPQAAFATGQEVTIAVNTAVTFDASESMDKEGNIRFYFWNFGDNSAEEYYTVPTVVHTYTNIGNYTLTAKVRDAYGEESTADVLVHVVAQTGNNGNTGNNGSTGNNGNNNGNNSGQNGNSNNGGNTTTTPTTGNNGSGNTNNQNNSDNTSNTEENNTSEQNNNNSAENNNQTGEEETIEPENTNEGLPTWIKIIFGSGALAAVAGAGLAINRIRKDI